MHLCLRVCASVRTSVCVCVCVKLSDALPIVPVQWSRCDTSRAPRLSRPSRSRSGKVHLWNETEMEEGEDSGPAGPGQPDSDGVLITSTGHLCGQYTSCCIEAEPFRRSTRSFHPLAYLNLHTHTRAHTHAYGQVRAPGPGKTLERRKAKVSLHSTNS